MSQQNQTDFLHQIAGWTKEACISNLDTALPQLIDHLENAAYIEDGIKTLKTLCDFLLPCVSFDALEEQIFLKINKHVNGLVDGALNKIRLNLEGPLKDSTEENLSSIVKECLQWTHEIGASLECCLQHTVACGPPSLEVTMVQSLPKCVLHFLSQVYQHCKESTDLYGTLMEVVSDSLSALFKKAHSLQMLLLGLLDKMCVSGAGLEEHVRILSSVCTGLFEVCTLVTSLDVKLSISLWKCISRLCSQHLSLLRDRLAVCPFITFLCKEIKEGYSYLFQLSPQAGPHLLSQGDDKAFSKTVKILGFQMKVVVALLRDFSDYLGECEADILALLLYMHRYLPPCLSASPVPEKQEAELRSQVVNATVPCLSHLVGNRAFRDILTQEDPEGDAEDKLPKLLLQLMMLDILPKCDDETVDAWLKSVKKSSETSSPSLLSAIFSSVKLCSVEMRLPVMLPGVVVAGQPQRQVNLYEHTVTHICGMVGACPARHFKGLESTFLSHVMGHDDLLSVLAVDCWCFLARYGTADVCNTQVQGLLSVYKKLATRRRSPSSRKLSCRLGHLLSRLIKLMSPEHQVSLVHRFPPESHPSLWLGLRPAGLASDLAQDVHGRIVAWALGVLTQPGGSVKASQLFLSLQHLDGVLTMTRSALSGPPASLLPSLSPHQQAQLLSAVSDLWMRVRVPPPASSDPVSPCLPPCVRHKLLVSLMPVTAHLLLLMDVKDLIVVLQNVDSMVKDPKCSLDICLKAAHLMSGFGQVKLGCSYMDNQALELLPQVFHTLLTHSHPAVHQQALTSFSQVASLTQHEDVVPACLRGEENLTLAVQNYLGQVPHHSQDKDFQLLDYLRSEENRTMEGCEGGPADKDLPSSGEQRKGKLIEHSGDDDLLVEPRTKRRRAISESDDEQQQPPLKNREKTDEPSALHDNIPDPLISTTTTATEAAPGEQSEGLGGQFQSLLSRLTTLASDLEKACCASSGAPPPAWFVEKANLEVARCQESLSLIDSCWFDSLT